MLVGETQVFPDGRALRRVPDRRHEPVLAADARACRPWPSRPPGCRLGFANPAIYARRRHAGAFSDVVPTTAVTATCAPTTSTASTPADGIVYSVRTFDQDTSLRTKKGWDDVTGVGTPTAIYPQVFADS